MFNLKKNIGTENYNYKNYRYKQKNIENYCFNIRKFVINNNMPFQYTHINNLYTTIESITVLK